MFINNNLGRICLLIENGGAILEIRKANVFDITSIMEIVDDARKLFASYGSNQWQGKDAYPNYATFKSDIDNENLYVVIIDNIIVGVAAIICGSEPTYNKIYQGKWLTSSTNYLTIHRLALKKEYYGKSIAKYVIDSACLIAKIRNVSSIRVDTYYKNKEMIGLLVSKGFSYCGKIYLDRKEENIDPERLAYEKVI